jgi:hypothetical protein
MMETEKQENQLTDPIKPQTEELIDLSVTTEQTEEIKGGTLPGVHKVTDVTLKRGVIG